MKLGNMVEVTWMDAKSEMGKDQGELDNTNPTDLLEETKTYGIYYKEDENAIIILTEKSRLGVDYTVIPKTWINKMRKLQ